MPVKQNNESLSLNNNYKYFLYDIKSRLKQSQIRAALAANTELVRFYWQLGVDVYVFLPKPIQKVHSLWTNCHGGIFVKAPIGISKYTLSKALPTELKSSHPTIEQIEMELGEII